jgi:hypothetical protein
MKRHIAAILAVSIFIATPAAMSFADEKQSEDLAIEGLNKLMQALSVFIDSIPQYAAPEVLENGDILIRRKNKDTQEQPEDKKTPGLEKTAT